jgi:hypothetical protein
MAQHSIGGADLLRTSTSHTPSLHSVITLRLTCGLVTLFGALISFLGTSWDIQWHAFVGRDRTLIPPHEMMLTGIALGGIATLVAIITETIWVRQHRSIATQFTPFAGLFSGSLGAYIAGYAALNAALAFPLDTYWHTLYGIDVTLWAPFHIMIISGMALMAFGSVYMLASAANLATSIHALRERRTAYIGMIVAFATALSLFTLLLFNATDQDYFLPLGFTSLSLFPVLSGLLLGCMLVAAVRALPWKWVATSITVVSLLFVLIDQLAVPPALVWLMQIEQLTFRAVHHSNPPQLSIVAISWPLLSLLSAILIDLFVQRAQKRGWSPQQLSIAIGLAVFVGCIPLTIENPVLSLDVITQLGVLGTLLSLIVGCLGVFIGTKLGQSVGETMSTLER